MASAINILAAISGRLNVTYYTAAEIARIVIAITSFRNVADDLRGFIIDCFRVLQGADTAFKKESLIELVEEVALQAEAVKYFRVSQEAAFCLTFTLKVGEDFTGTFLTARDREDDTALSPLTIAGDSQINAPTQVITINDLTLTAGSFYQVNYLTEGDTAAAANGEAGTLLAKVYFYVTKGIDSV